jgi:hypothetical protein
MRQSSTILVFLFLTTSLSSALQSFSPQTSFKDTPTTELNRRDFGSHSMASLTSGCSIAFLGNVSPTSAEDSSTRTLFAGKVKNTGISYQLELPPTFQESRKPVKTHFDELLFSSSEMKGSIGITIDPLRIKSLKQFGSAQEIAARVVTAEVNRDGIFEVTLLKDPYESPDGSFVSLEYLSDGKRGKKVILTKIYVVEDGTTAPSYLCVLTAQVKNDDYPTTKDQLNKAVDSFIVTSSKT